MKLKLLTLAVATAATVSAMNAYAEPTVYGQINVSMDYLDPEVGDGSWDLSDNSSRIGVKGEEDIGGIAGVYQLEFGTQATDGSGINSSRNSFVGFKGDFGTVFVGKHDTPFKAAQGKIDLFGDTALDLEAILGGEERTANVIGWKSANMNGFSAFALVQPGEEDTDNETEVLDGPADAVSVSLNFETDELFLAAAYDMNQAWDFWADAPFGAAPALSRTDAFRLTGMYKMDTMGFGVMYQSAEQSDIANPAEQTGYYFSAYAKADQTKFNLAIGQSEHEQAGEDNVDLMLWAIGAEQMLSKRTSLYANYGSIDTEVSLETGGTVSDSELGIFMVGALHKF